MHQTGNSVVTRATLSQIDFRPFKDHTDFSQWVERNYGPALADWANRRLVTLAAVSGAESAVTIVREELHSEGVRQSSLPKVNGVDFRPWRDAEEFLASLDTLGSNVRETCAQRIQEAETQGETLVVSDLISRIQGATRAVDLSQNRFSAKFRGVQARQRDESISMRSGGALSGVIRKLFS